MASPFPGVPTQHIARIDATQYVANYAWDVLGISPLRAEGEILWRSA